MRVNQATRTGSGARANKTDVLATAVRNMGCPSETSREASAPQNVAGGLGSGPAAAGINLHSRKHSPLPAPWSFTPDWFTLKPASGSWRCGPATASRAWAALWQRRSQPRRPKTWPWLGCCTGWVSRAGQKRLFTPAPARWRGKGVCRTHPPGPPQSHWTRSLQQADRQPPGRKLLRKGLVPAGKPTHPLRRARTGSSHPRQRRRPNCCNRVWLRPRAQPASHCRTPLR